MTAMGLQLRDISKRYGPAEILPPLSLDIPSGQFLTVLGPSGSGKTTVLRLIGGFTEPSGGSVLFDSKDITNLPANKRPFNTVFQDYALFPHMTVADNVGYGPLVQRFPTDRSKKKIAETLAIVGLGDLHQRYPSQLSGGQRQRVALARAIVCEPKVILLDEPLAALDASLRHQMQHFLKSIQRHIQTTFVFVTHDQKEAISMSDRIVVMKAGRIEQDGTPEELYHQPRTRFVAGFFGDNNLIEGSLSPARNAVNTAIGRLACRAAPSTIASGDKVLLGIRPESLHLGAGKSGFKATVSDVLFGGATVSLKLRPKTAPEVELDMIVQGGGTDKVPTQGELITVSYDPAQATIVPAGD
ncbi:MAG: ABC transporter ATP-binding protein [Aestuariivirga sp.]